MVQTKDYLNMLFKAKGILVSQKNINLFEEFTNSIECVDTVSLILEKQNQMMESWRIKNRIADINSQQIIIPNATIGKQYEAHLDFKKLNLDDLNYIEIESIEEIGLVFNKITYKIEGVPSQSGDFKIKLIYKIEGEDEKAALNEKFIPLIINPDPKSLWKDIPSNVNDIFWKEDDISIFDKLGDKNIVVSSKRGRSHENVGSFRDDDFAFKYFNNSGWSVVAISDGAGSYSLSRKGSQIACNAVVEYFELHADLEKTKEFEAKLLEYTHNQTEDLHKETEVLAKQILYKATVFVHNQIKLHSDETFLAHPNLFDNPKAKTYLDYYHATLIFTLFKKFDFGYVVLTFGVGDCPIAIMNKEETETTLLNWLDVGEFGGGTRFITQTDIFHSNERPMSSRYNFKIVSDFSYLFLMTDGIYDPKFVVEANLEKNEKWIEFLNDLKGNNDDNISIDFNKSNNEIALQLSNWMDFWSQGNHDDRTLAIIF